MIINLLFILLSLLKINLVWLVLFPVCYLRFFKPRYLIAFILVYGFVFDLLWVFNLGQTGLFLTLFWLFFELYARKYNGANPLFLFIYLLACSLLSAAYFGLHLGIWEVLLFVFAYIMLIAKTHLVFKTAGESLVGKKIRV
jgi:hypothetical protein